MNYTPSDGYHPAQVVDEHNPYDDRGAASAKKKRQSRDRAVRAQWEGDVQWLMGQKRGRRVVFKLLEDSSVFHPTFNTNALSMAHAEGRRDMGLRLLEVIKRSSAEEYFTMLREHGGTDD